MEEQQKIERDNREHKKHKTFALWKVSVQQEKSA